MSFPSCARTVELEDTAALEVQILAKSQKLLMQLCSIEEFTFEGKKNVLHWIDAERLSIGVDNDIARALLHLGVVDLSSESSRRSCITNWMTQFN